MRPSRSMRNTRGCDKAGFADRPGGRNGVASKKILTPSAFPHPLRAPRRHLSLLGRIGIAIALPVADEKRSRRPGLLRFFVPRSARYHPTSETIHARAVKTARLESLMDSMLRLRSQKGHANCHTC